MDKWLVLWLELAKQMEDVWHENYAGRLSNLGPRQRWSEMTWCCISAECAHTLPTGGFWSVESVPINFQVAGGLDY